MKPTITRREFSKKFAAKAEKNGREIKRFGAMAFKRPKRYVLYGEILRFPKYEVRYYRLARPTTPMT